MIEIGIGVVVVGLIMCLLKRIAPWIRVANDLQSKQKTKGYWFEDWD